MPNAVIIRPRRDNDLPALADALVHVHTVDGYPVEGVTDPSAWLHHPHELQSWTAEVAGHPVGQTRSPTLRPTMMLHGYGMNEQAATLAAWRYPCACSLIQITAALVPDDSSCEPPQSTRVSQPLRRFRRHEEGPHRNPPL
jgi:hypothetical protein